MSDKNEKPQGQESAVAAVEGQPVGPVDNAAVDPVSPTAEKSKSEKRREAAMKAAAAKKAKAEQAKAKKDAEAAGVTENKETEQPAADLVVIDFDSDINIRLKKKDYVGRHFELPAEEAADLKVAVREMWGRPGLK